MTAKDTMFRWLRPVAVALSILLFAYAGMAAWKNYSEPPGVDFVSFWAAGHLTIEGQPDDSYKLAEHRNAELLTGRFEGLVPFPYPPPYLLLMAPFGALPFWAAFPLWVALLCTLFFLVFRRLVPRPYIFAHPAALPNVLVGQNGMLTASIFFAGLSLLGRREWLAGAILGGLVIKPQLGLLIPVALVAGRYWRAFAGAALSALLLLVTALVTFGAETYRAFFAMIPEQAAFLSGQIPWPKVASLYGALRTLAVPESVAMALHAGLALVAAVLTWLAWVRRYDTRIPLLAAASLLISPYLFTYDSLLLLIPIGWLIVRRERPWLVILLWTLSFVALFAKVPNPTAIAAAIALWVMWRDGTAEGAGQGPRPAPGDGK